MAYYVQTPCGPIQGCPAKFPGIAAYKGIRYATAGRWEYPQLVTHWDGVWDGSGFGYCSYQPRAFYDESQVPEKAFYYNEFRRGESYEYSEDCLFLNVYTPEDVSPDAGLPVLVYIHGGGFTGGCGHEKHFDCPIWPTKGVIGVTINYRLGPLGFLCLPELKQEAGATGNYGLYDQVAALTWVRDNIASFGGNPDNVTIMGQSAGAMSVQQLCLSPLTDGLFCKAVMSSGGGVSKLMPTDLPEKSYDFWHAVMDSAGCANLEQFRALAPEKLFEIWQNLKKTFPDAGKATAPVIDGRLIVGTGSDLLKQGRQKKIHYMAGSTSEDIVPPVVYEMAKLWCEAQSESSYAWFFDRRLPGDENGAWHSSDLWYWFGTLANCWRPMTEKDYDLSRQMTQYLVNFCRYGDPNGAGLTAWLPMTKGQGKVLCLGEEDTHMGHADLVKLTKTMLTNKAVGE